MSVTRMWKTPIFSGLDSALCLGMFRLRAGKDLRVLLKLSLEGGQIDGNLHKAVVPLPKSRYVFL